MRSLVLAGILIFEAVAAGPCPSGYSYYDQTKKCYKVYEQPMTYFAASIECSNDNAELVSIHNAFENSYISELIPDNFMDHWIGLQNMLDGYEFTWLDDTNVGYVKWGQGEPNREWNCVRLELDYYVWGTQQCTAPLPFVCGFDPAVNRTCPTCPTSTPCPTCAPRPVCDAARSVMPLIELEREQHKPEVLGQLNCPEGYSYSGTYERCYKLSGDVATFFQASELCSLDNAELASIHSGNENQFIGDLMPSVDYDQPFWIGMTSLLDNWGEWNWLDGTNLQYFNWLGGSPNATMSCTKFHSLTAAWSTQNCDMKFPYICEFNPTANHDCPACPVPTPCPACPTYPPCPKATTPPPPPCDADWEYLNATKSCYYLLTGAGNNAAAQSRCRSLGAYIASVHSDAENNYLWNRAYGGSLWVGAHRTGAGSGCVTCFENDDGTTFDYWKWYNGEPNNLGGNEYCVQMFTSPDYKGAPAPFWNDLPCYNYSDLVICKRPSRS